MSVVSQQSGFTAYGVDGCPAGWFAVGLRTNGKPEWRVHPKFADLVNVADAADCIFVDIPIGLPTGPEERECDQKARKVLAAPRASSVFRTPVRAVFAARDYAEAGKSAGQPPPKETPKARG